MPAFTGSLNANLVFAAIYNMIISQEVFADNIGSHQTLVDRARVDGGLYGDTKLYYATDVLKSHAWGGDSEASNLLSLDRPAAPKCQAIEINLFRQIRVTVDDYLTKQAWKEEGSFSAFNGVILGWIRETKRIYDGTIYNTFIGTAASSTGRQTETVDVSTAVTGLSGVEAKQMEAMTIAEFMANLFVDISDYSRDFNDYAYLRSTPKESLFVVWNSKYVNAIKKVDLPTIFHKEGLVDKFEEFVLPSRYFGIVITASNKSSYAAGTPTTNKPIDSDDDTYVPGSNNANGCIRSLVEKDVTVSAVSYHVFAGDEIPAGATIKSGGNFELGEVYIETSDVVCKIMNGSHLPPYLSAFEVGTSFFNPRSLTENHYLTFGRNTLEYLKNYPFITVKKA